MHNRWIQLALLLLGVASLVGYVFQPHVMFLSTAAVLFAAGVVLTRKSKVASPPRKIT